MLGQLDLLAIEAISARVLRTSVSSKLSTLGSQGKYPFITKMVASGKENFVAWSLKLEQLTLETYLVKLLFHKVARPPLPLPLETCLVSLTAGTMNMSN